MLKYLLLAAITVLALPLCAQTLQYKIIQHSTLADRYYSICFGPGNHVWAGGRPYGLRLHRVDANLNSAGLRGLNPDQDPGVQYYPSEIATDADAKTMSCGNYQDGSFGRGFVLRMDLTSTPSKLLFFKKIEGSPGNAVRVSGVIDDKADTSLLVYGTSLINSVRRGELFKLNRNTGEIKPGFPKRYTLGSSLSLDAAILHGGRLYTAGASSVDGNTTTFALSCIDPTTGDVLWFSANPFASGQPMHLEARDLVFTDDDGDALVVVGSGDDQHSPAQGSHIFLQKTALDGTMRWIKKIDLPDWTDEYAEEIVTVSDGYLIYGRSRNAAQQGVFLLKTDLNGRPLWAKRINRGLQTGLPDWPAQSQMIVNGEAIYLTCNSVITGAFGPEVALLVKLQLDGTLANCSIVQPTPAVNLPFGNLSTISVGLNVSTSTLQANNIPVPVQGSSPTSIAIVQPCNQNGYICNDRPDLRFRVDSLYCSSDIGGQGGWAKLCNDGKVPHYFFNVSFYDSNPLTGPAKRLLTRRFFDHADSQSCTVVNFPFATVLKNNTKVYTLLGADSLLQTPISLDSFPRLNSPLECDYANNLDSFDVILPPECYPDPCTPATFLKILGKKTDDQDLSCIRASGDGNLYVAGEQNERILLSKVAPDGQFLWSRSFTLPPFQNIGLSEFIVDSEGMIVGCGGHSNNAPMSFAFRYDPNAHQMLWVQMFQSDRVSGGGILEKTPGGNYLLYQSPRLPDFLVFNGEILELDRATGQIVPATLGKRYQHGYATVFARVLAHEGALYAAGHADSIANNELVRRTILAKLDPNTGEVAWSRTGHTDWLVPSYFQGYDLVADDNSLLMLYYGSEETYRINLGDGIPLYTFLQKSTLDGEVLWVKRYNIAAQNIVAVPDGYIITRRGNRQILKVDKNGNVLNSKGLSTAFFSGGGSGRHSVEQVGAHLYFVNGETYQGGQDRHSLLLKTGLDLESDFPCSGYVTIEVKDSVTARPPLTFEATQILSASPAVQQVPDAVVGIDSVTVRETCPVCPPPVCTDKPDITCRVDSIYCSSGEDVFINIKICNLGQVAPTQSTHVNFYDKNPFTQAATRLTQVTILDKPDSSICITFPVPLDASLLQYAKIYTLTGIKNNTTTPISLDSFPFADGFAECNYANNLDSFEVKLPAPQKPDLGPDRSICQGEILLLDPGDGYVQYHWNTGSNDQAIGVATTGNYVVDVIDACGRKLYDTVRVTVFSYPKRTVSLVLLPGDSVVIGGVVYFGAATVRDTIPTLTGVCDTLVTYNIHLDTLHCDQPGAFFKLYEGVSGRVLVAAADGGYYAGGESAKGSCISRFDASGKNLWVRAFDLFGGALIQTLIEDSEGMLVGSATAEGTVTSVVVFRYDPTSDQMLWAKRHDAQTNFRGHEIVEKSPGGDYLLTCTRSTSPVSFRTEMFTFDRATGDTPAGGLWRYEFEHSMSSLGIHQGALYVQGFMRDTAVTSLFRRGGLTKIDLNTGVPEWSRLTKTPGIDLGSGNLIVDGDGNIVTLLSQNGMGIWLQKTAPSGDLIWLKRIEISDPNEQAFNPLGLVLVNDGYGIGIITYSTVTSLNSYLVVKADKNGDLLWARKVLHVDGWFTLSPHQLASRGNEICFTSNLRQNFFQFAGMVLGKFDKLGNLGESCGAAVDVPVQITAQVGSQIPAEVVFTQTGVPFEPQALTNSIPSSTLQNTLCAKCGAACDSIFATRTIAFYPGDTIVIDGTAYTQSGTVVQTFTTPAGCDSVVTNILQLVVTEVKITCPADLTVTLPPNETTTAVDYSLPAATTDCPDPTLDLRLLQGQPVGGTFPQGATLVCYEAANQCGIRDTCCFTVTAEQPDSPCDVKAPVGCLRYELLSIRLDALGQPRYRVRVTNTCASPLEYACVQLPNGVLAVSPKEGATYAAPSSGNAYAVRNPNASPFYSVRYKAVTGNLNNGESDIFEHTLPQQSAPAYIRVSAKLADGSTSAAHLNTFFCPVLPYEAMENLEWSMENGATSRHSKPATLHSQLSVWPSPTTGIVFADLSFWRSQTLRLQVLNAQGQTVLRRQVFVEDGPHAVSLPSGLAGGLYYLNVLPENGGPAAARFVVEQ